MDVTGGNPVLVRQSGGRRHVRPSGTHARTDDRGRRRPGSTFRLGALIALPVAVAVGAAAYAHESGIAMWASQGAPAETRSPAATTSVLADAADKAAAQAAAAMFASAPVAVVANPSRAADLAEATVVAERAHAPLLLVSPILRAAVRSLGTRTVIDVGVPQGVLRAELPRVRLTTDPGALPAA